MLLVVTLPCAFALMNLSQRKTICQDQAVEQTFVVDCSRLLSGLLLIINVLIYMHWTAPQSIDPTGFLPIDPMPRTFPRRDDMGRKAGMSCFVEPAGCLDCFVLRQAQQHPRNDAKRQRVQSQEKVQRKVFRVGMPTLHRDGRGGMADMAGKRSLCGKDR